MNKFPPEPEGSGAGGPDRSRRGQSEVLALVALFGMIFVGATVVIISGGYLVDSVQGSSQHELAKDNAVQTHQSIAEALQSGEARNLGVGDDVDVSVLESGSIAIEMRNSSGGACYGDDDRVEADLGAIVYDTPKGEVIYQGGAIWERTEAGLSTVRAPPIAYDDDTARISIQTVSAEADSFEGEMARPNETMQTKMAEETDQLLTRCPANGYTDLKITLTSPNYAERWENHFEERVNTTDNTDVYKSGPDTVVAEISNATNAHPSRGLRFTNITAPTVVGPNGDDPKPDQFNVTAEMVNDDFEPRDPTVELVINGTVRSTGPATVRTTGAKTVSVPGGTGLHRNDLADTDGNFSLEPNEAHDYTVRLRDGDGQIVENATGRFFLEDADGGNVTFYDDSHHFEDDEDTLVVNATLINTIPNPADDELILFNITADAVNMQKPVPTGADAVEDAEIDVPANGGTNGISYEINVSQLHTGTYEYELKHVDGKTLERRFTINDPPEDSGSTVGDLRVEDIDPSANYVKNGTDFEVRVQLHNRGTESTTPEVSIDLSDESLSDTEDNVTIADGERKNVTVDLDADDLATLETRTEHDYEVTIEDSGEADSFPGTFVLLEPNDSLQIEDHGTEADDDWRWINATLANHGMEQGSDTATLTVYDNETDEEVGHIDTDEPVTLDSANETTIPFGFNVSELGGTYRYEVRYDEDVVEGHFTEGEADTGDGNVSITEPGKGTVSVLGTEISSYPGCAFSLFGSCIEDEDPPEKGWAPTTVSTILETGEEETVIPFNNSATDSSSYNNKTNLNTYDTQEAVYTYGWTQDEGESATLTVSSSYWSMEDDEVVNTRDGVEDVQPGHDILDDSPTRTVNAHSGANKEAVRVLKDGDEVPNPQTSGEDQRSAAEVLNQGDETADRIEDGRLSLGPYEAVFLFELTTESYDGMWNDSHDKPEDPDYNDVIALVSFNPDEPDDVNFDVGDHSLSIGPAPDDPEETSNTGEQDVGFDGSTLGPGAGSDPVAPDPNSPDPGSPSGPDEIDVDVGGVVIG